MAYQPKSYRKFVATAATATLVASAIAPVAGAASNFEDVAPKYKDAVDYLVNNNITQGTTPTTFGTHDNIKRGDLAIWLAKALKLDTASAPASGFEDTAGTRYDAAVSVLKAKGIVSGKSETSYEPSAYVTRGEMAIMLSRAYELSTDEKAPFTDMGAYAPYINGLYAYEITTGKTPETFGTALNITRGDLAIFLKRAAEVVKTPVVKSVTPLNATEVVVAFNVEVNKDSAETEGNYKIGANSPASATLNADKKSVTLTFSSAAQVEVENAVLVVEPIKTAKDSSVSTTKYTQVFSYDDTVRPTVSGVSYPTNSTAKVTFSEAVDVLNGGALEEYVTIKDSKGNAVSDAGLLTLAADKKSFTINTAGFTKGEAYTVSIVGLKDLGNNLISPNPAVVTVNKTEVDAVDPTVSSVTSLDTNKFKVVFSEALNTSGTYFEYTVDGGSKVTVNSGNASVSDDKKEFVVTLGAPLAAGPHTIAIESYVDPSGNVGSKSSKLINFQADTTNPTVKSTTVETIDGVRYIALEVSEEVTLSAKDLSFSYLRDGVLATGTIKASALSLVDSNDDGAKETVLINTEDFDGAGADLKSGQYTISLPAALVTDTSQNTNDNAAASVKVTLGDLSNTDTTKPGISAVNVQVANNGTVEVVFAEEVSNETALNLANYTIEGQQVFEKAVFIGDKTTVRLTLKDGAVSLNGDYLFEVKNVKDKAGNVMNSYKSTVEFTENTAPALVSAALTANDTITLTFSEAMEVSSIVETLAAEADFEVYVNGVKETGVVEASVDSKKFTLKLSDALTSAEYNSTITIKPTADFDVTDDNGNAHPTFDSVTVAK